MQLPNECCGIPITLRHEHIEEKPQKIEVSCIATESIKNASILQIAARENKDRLRMLLPCNRIQQITHDRRSIDGDIKLIKKNHPGTFPRCTNLCQNDLSIAIKGQINLLDNLVAVMRLSYRLGNKCFSCSRRPKQEAIERRLASYFVIEIASKQGFCTL